MRKLSLALAGALLVNCGSKQEEPLQNEKPDVSSKIRAVEPAKTETAVKVRKTLMDHLSPQERALLTHREKMHSTTMAGWQRHFEEGEFEVTRKSWFDAMSRYTLAMVMIEEDIDALFARPEMTEANQEAILDWRKKYNDISDRRSRIFFGLKDEDRKRAEEGILGVVDNFLG